MTVSPTVRIRVSGARGESLPDVLRRLGVKGTLPTDSDGKALENYAKVVIDQNPGFQGDKGNPGAGGNVAVGRAQLKGVTASTGDVWTLSEGGRSGDFVLHPAGFVAPADPREGIFITTNSGRVFERVFSGPLDVRWFGAIGDGKYDTSNVLLPGWTDDRDAIQAAIDFNVLRGGGAITGPDAVYVLGGAPTSRNGMRCMLHMPSLPSILDMQMCQLGGSAGAALSGGPKGGFIIHSTYVGDVDGARAAVIGGQSAGAGNISYCTVRLQNMIVRQGQNPSLHGVNLNSYHIAERQNLRIDVQGGFDTSGVVALLNVAEPIGKTFGYIGPRNNVPYRNVAEDTLVFGYYYGEEWRELQTGTRIGISACKIALSVENGTHPSVVDFLEVISCGKTVVATGSPNEIFIGKLDVEKSHNVPAWINYTNDIEDPNNALRGIINWHMHESELANISPWTVVGARNLRLNHVGQNNEQVAPFTNTFTQLRGQVTASSLRELKGGPTAIPWRQDIVSTDDALATVGVHSFANMGGPAPDSNDYRVAQARTALHQNARSGQRVWATARNGVLVEHLALDSLGNLILLNPGNHLVASGGGDISGVMTIAAGQTSVTKNFVRSFGTGPVATVTPGGAPLPTGVNYSVTTTATTITITVSAAQAGPVSFGYHIIGS